jgi:hypothetical protein
MPDKLITALGALTLTEANEDTRLLPWGHGTTGQLAKVTVAQAKELFKPVALKYVTDGAEGSTLSIGALSGKEILIILRESGPIFEVPSSPISSEFTWDGTDIVLGAAVGGVGERFLILYTNS